MLNFKTYTPGYLQVSNKLLESTLSMASNSKAGYEYLLAYKITIPIYDYTVAFCKRCQSPNSPNFPNLPNSPDQAVNLLITLINQAIYLQKKLKLSLEQKFIAEGGFRENLFKKRLEFRRNN